MLFLPEPKIIVCTLFSLIFGNGTQSYEKIIFHALFSIFKLFFFPDFSIIKFYAILQKQIEQKKTNDHFCITEPHFETKHFCNKLSLIS